jgi:hypothetical protein
MSEDESSAREKPELTQVLKELGDQAIGRHMKRQATPALKITLEDGKWWFGSPYRDQDEDYWVALLFDAFGTRSQATFRTFMIQLSTLCSTVWDKQSEARHPDEDELIAAVQIVRSTKPRNEAEACLAAQMVAVHMMQMRVSATALRHDWTEPRSCAIAGKLARTYAMQLETMAKLKGRGTRQRITVRKYSRHEHKHVHLHQGGSENGNQPHGPRDTRQTEINASHKPEECASLPGPHTTQHAMSVPNHEGEDAMSPARRREQIRSPAGKSKRSV